jgi:hypothetical protein
MSYSCVFTLIWALKEVDPQLYHYIWNMSPSLHNVALCLSTHKHNGKSGTDVHLNTYICMYNFTSHYDLLYMINLIL